MKKLLILLLLPVFCWGQEKGTTKIIIQNELSARDNFNLVVKTLMDNDYFIEAKDSELFTVKTQPKKPGKGYGLSFLNIRTNDKEIQISGMWKSGIEMSIYGVNSTDSYEPIANKSGMYRAVFSNMNDFAMKFEGNKTYK